MQYGANIIKTADNEQLASNSVLRLSHTEEDPADQFVKGQRDIKRRLQQAVVYGKAALKDFVRKSAYEKAADGKSPFDVAFADFLNAPSIDAIDLSEYTGRVGSRIFITVIDDFIVTSVFVKIQNSDGSVADEGYAAQGLFATEWIFTASRDNPVLKGDKITITATDLPGNDSDLEHHL